MPEYKFHHEVVTDGDTVDVPSNARDVSFQHELHPRGFRVHVSWFEKQGDSVQ